MIPTSFVLIRLHAKCITLCCTVCVQLFDRFLPKVEHKSTSLNPFFTPRQAVNKKVCCNNECQYGGGAQHSSSSTRSANFSQHRINDYTTINDGCILRQLRLEIPLPSPHAGKRLVYLAVWCDAVRCGVVVVYFAGILAVRWIFFAFFFFILRRMWKNKALAHHTFFFFFFNPPADGEK